MVGLGELLARLERRRQLLAAEGLFAARAQAAAAVPAAPASGWSPRRARPPSATSSRTPGAAGRRSRFEVAHAAMQGPRAAREVIEALERLDRDPDVDVIVIARGGGSVEDLLPFSDEALVRAVAAARTPVVSRDRPRARHPAARPGRRRPRLHAHRRRQADRARRRRGAAARRPAARDRVRARAATRWLEPRAARPRRAAVPPGARRPAHASSTARRRGRELARPRPPSLAPPARPRPPTTSAHQRARVRALSPLATLRRGYAVLQDADGHVRHRASTRSTPATGCSVRVADGRIARDRRPDRRIPQDATATDETSRRPTATSR